MYLDWRVEPNQTIFSQSTATTIQSGVFAIEFQKACSNLLTNNKNGLTSS